MCHIQLALQEQPLHYLCCARLHSYDRKRSMYFAYHFVLFCLPPCFHILFKFPSLHREFNSTNSFPRLSFRNTTNTNNNHHETIFCSRIVQNQVETTACCCYDRATTERHGFGILFSQNSLLTLGRCCCIQAYGSCQCTRVGKGSSVVELHHQWPCASRQELTTTRTHTHRYMIPSWSILEMLSLSNTCQIRCTYKCIHRTCLRIVSELENPRLFVYTYNSIMNFNFQREHDQTCVWVYWIENTKQINAEAIREIH